MKNNVSTVPLRCHRVLEWERHGGDRKFVVE